MNRHKFFLAISMFSRIGVGVVMLLVLARGLGPEDYGFIVTVFAYSQVVALLTDFGFGVQALRDIGAEPNRAGAIISACLRVKNILTAIATLIALVVLLSLQLDPGLLVASIFLYLSIIVLSYGDLVLVVFRGIGRYDIEAGIVVAGTILFAAIVGPVALMTSDILQVSLALLGARAAQSCMAFGAVIRNVQLENCFAGRLRETWSFTKSSAATAVDTILTAFTGQLDIILASSLFGLAAAGNYQVAARLAGFALLPSQVLAGVYIPSLSKIRLQDYKKLQENERSKIIEFSTIAAIMALSYFFLSTNLYNIIFGYEFHIPENIWIAFSIIIFIRYFTSLLGVFLIVRKDSWVRISAQLICIFSIILISLLFGSYGIISIPISVMIGVTLALILYVIGLYIGRKYDAPMMPKEGSE